MPDFYLQNLPHVSGFCLSVPVLCRDGITNHCNVTPAVLLNEMKQRASSWSYSKAETSGQTDHAWKAPFKKKKRGENITEGDWMSLGTPTVGKSFSGLRSGSAGSFLVSSLLLISAVQAQLLHWCSSQPFLLEARLPLYLSLVLERRKKEVRLYPSTSFPISLFLCKWGLQYKYIFVYQNTHMHTTDR